MRLYKLRTYIGIQNMGKRDFRINDEIAAQLKESGGRHE